MNDIIDVFTGLWGQIQTSKVVGALWPNDPDGKVWAEMFTPKLKARGYKVVDVGRFPYGMQDYSAFINTWKKEKVDIITGVMIPPDWATCWRQCHQQGFIPKAATIGKAILFPSAVEALGGNLPNISYISYISDNDFFKEKIESFPVTRFLLELTQHIPPRGLQYIRRYGLYASRTKGKWPDMPHVIQLAPAGWKAERLKASDPVQSYYVVMIKETGPSSWRAGDSKVGWVIKKHQPNTPTTGDG